MAIPAGVVKWQTRQTQNLLYASMWGFKSLHRHTLFASEEGVGGLHLQANQTNSAVDAQQASRTTTTFRRL